MNPIELLVNVYVGSPQTTWNLRELVVIMRYPQSDHHHSASDSHARASSSSSSSYHSDRLQLIVTDKQIFYYECNLTESVDYRELCDRMQIKVSFRDFPGQVKTMLENCQRESATGDVKSVRSGTTAGGNSNIKSMHDIPSWSARLTLTSAQEAQFEIIETNTFKGNKYLDLTMRAGSDAVVKQYLLDLKTEYMTLYEKTRAKLQSREEELQETQLQCEALQEKVNCMENEYQKESVVGEKKHNTELKQLQDQFELERNTVRTKYEQELQEKEKSYSRELLAEKQEYQELLEKFLQLEKSNSKAETSLRATELKLQRSEEQCESLRLQVERMKLSKSETEARLHKSEEANVQQRIEVSSLQAEVNSLKTLHAQSESMLNATIQQKTVVEEALQYHKQQNEKLEKRLQLTIDEIHKANKIIPHLQQKIAQHKTTIMQEQNQSQQLKQLVSQKESTINKCQLEIESLNRKLEMADQSLEQVRGHNDELKSKLADAARKLAESTSVSEWLSRQLNEAKKNESMTPNRLFSSSFVPSMNNKTNTSVKLDDLMTVPTKYRNMSPSSHESAKENIQ